MRVVDNVGAKRRQTFRDRRVEDRVLGRIRDGNQRARKTREGDRRRAEDRRLLHSNRKGRASFSQPALPCARSSTTPSLSLSVSVCGPRTSNADLCFGSFAQGQQSEREKWGGGFALCPSLHRPELRTGTGTGVRTEAGTGAGSCQRRFALLTSP